MTVSLHTLLNSKKKMESLFKSIFFSTKIIVSFLFFSYKIKFFFFVITKARCQLFCIEGLYFYTRHHCLIKDKHEIMILVSMRRLFGSNSCQSMNLGFCSTNSIYLYVLVPNLDESLCNGGSVH